jgi:hypothetical protein
MALIIEFLDNLYGDVPTRCALHGMHGVGKSQLFYSLAKDLYDKGRYMDAGDDRRKASSRLLEVAPPRVPSRPFVHRRQRQARRWLEDFNSGRWLLVIDNVAREAINFLREHLPRKNARGNILFTTRTEDVAKALTDVAGKRHGIVELRIPGVEDATEMFLKHLNDPKAPANASKIQEAVKGINFCRSSSGRTT